MNAKQPRKNQLRHSRPITTESDSPCYSAAQTRVMSAALKLFSESGVNGTSLQMIANEVGVTKAAVYHQFKSKDEIVIAAAGMIFDQLGAIVKRADTQLSLQETREVIMDGLIELAVERRNAASFLQRDPVMLRIFEEHQPFRQVMQRLDELLVGGNNSSESRVTVAMLMTSIGGTVSHPLVAEVDNDILRAQLKKLLHSLFEFLN